MQIIALHQQMADELNNLFGVRNTIVVNNGIDLDRFKNAKPDKKHLKTLLGIPSEAYVIGHVGRFAPQKNHELLVKIFEQVRKENEKAFLLLVGTGALEEQVRQWLKDRNLEKYALILTHRNDVQDLMKIMDVFLFPSLYEGLGIVLIEAQASKLKCVIANTIPKQAIVSNFVSVLGLKEPVGIWSKEVLRELPQAYKCDFTGWDIKDAVKQLEEIYG